MHTAELLRPYLSQARAPVTREVGVIDEQGRRQTLSIPAERALTVYVDRRELVTLMTLGTQPELLVLGWLRNQRLVRSLDEIESITVDWEVGAAAVKTRHGQGIVNVEERTAKRVVTTGCGQGSVFGGLMDEVEGIVLPDPSEAQLSQAQLYAIVNTIRLQQSIYKSAGSVHGCALFQTQSGSGAEEGQDMLVFVEDVGRHNAIDTIAGWMWMNDVEGGDKAFYTTGRLTSEMIIKSAQMGVPIAISRSGITQMGHAVAAQLTLCTIGRATGKHFYCYTAPERLRMQPELAER
jgi:FdhD protein